MQHPIPNTQRRTPSTSLRRAFTLIELLVVIAITSILLLLIILPVIQTFNVTRAAQSFAEAQTKARQLTEKIAREINNSVGVRDNAGVRGEIALVVPGSDKVTPEVVNIPYAKLDIYRPAEEGSGSAATGFIDPNTGKVDPTLKAPKGQMTLPVAPGSTLVRYFVGLRAPFTANGNAGTYNNPYDGLLMARNSDRDNLYVIYRAEIPAILSTGAVNPEFFADSADMDNPEFFTLIPGDDYNATTGVLDGDAATTNKVTRMKNWLRKAIIQTEVSRFDVVQPVYNRNTRQVVYDGTVPRIQPLIQFKPTRITNEPAEGMLAYRIGEETDSPERLAPDVFRTQYGAWSSPTVRLFPSGYDHDDTNLNESLIAARPAGGGDYSIYFYDPEDPSALPNTEDVDVPDNSADELFSVTRYEQAVANSALSRFPFTYGLNGANLAASARARAVFSPFFVDPSGGKVLAGFGINLVGNNAAPVSTISPENWPFQYTGLPLTPQNDTNSQTRLFNEQPSINQRFNSLYNQFPQYRSLIHRYIDLRVTPQADGQLGPLHPSFGFARAKIVPGSEIIFGPDSLPGSNYGAMIRYTRTTGTPGPNQYRINYVDQPEPQNSSDVVDYSTLGIAPADLAAFNPTTYNAANFVSAVVQPQYKAGYVELYSDPTVPLPGDYDSDNDPSTNVDLDDLKANIQVYYKFYFMEPQDVVTVDYDSRQIMSVLVTIRNYPQSNLPDPQSVTLKSTARVRNFLR